MISLNPILEPFDAGSTLLIPTVRKAPANSSPIAAYEPTVASNNILRFAPVDRDHRAANLRRLIGNQMNQQFCHLTGLNPF